MAKQRKQQKPKRLKLKALNNLSGRYNLPFSKDQVFTIDVNRGEELVNNEDAVKVK